MLICLGSFIEVKWFAVDYRTNSLLAYSSMVSITSRHVGVVSEGGYKVVTMLKVLCS